MNHIANLRAAIAAVEAQPELDLAAYRRQHPCGTLFCVAGLLPVTEHFIKLGVTANGAGRPRLPAVYDVDDTLDDLFGTYGRFCAYDVLCEPYGFGKWDDELLAAPERQDLTHKELALARLNKALEIRLDEAGEAEAMRRRQELPI